MLYDLQSSTSMTHKSGIFSGDLMSIPAPPLELKDYAPELRTLAETARRSTSIRRRDPSRLFHVKIQGIREYSMEGLIKKRSTGMRRF